MLKIKNGKLTHAHFAFALPEGFNLITEHEALECENISFVSDDKKTFIKITFDKTYGAAEEDLTGLCADCGFVKKGGFLRVKRGAGQAVGLYYATADNRLQYYEELYDFDGFVCNRFSVYIEHNAEAVPLESVLKAPQVKNFFDGIEYL